MLKDKTIIVGVSSSVALYKACEIVSSLKKLAADVWVVMTDEAAKLVTPLTFRTLSHHPVITDLFGEELSLLPVPHIALADKADLLLIAPCTANVIGKLAGGIADDALTTMVMASTAPKIIAPAMNANMWRNPIVLANVEKLRAEHYAFVGPATGRLACGVTDIGRLAPVEEIVSAVIQILAPRQDLSGKRVLIAAGGTQEAIDAVRYITNRSSGKMGYALAAVARERGAEVVLISAPVNLSAPKGVALKAVHSAEEMLQVVEEHYAQSDAVIMAAAVADYQFPQSNLKTKLKKSTHDLTLTLKPTPDILQRLAKRKDRRGKIHVGFALETESLIKNARQKLKAKDLDLVIANGPETLEDDSIAFQIIDRKNKVFTFPKQAKAQAAGIILDQVAKLFKGPMKAHEGP
jgi:phosphopantothenoylcysteine decarboxylase/phosphopantothenate--cysteine ligase